MKNVFLLFGLLLVANISFAYDKIITASDEYIVVELSGMNGSDGMDGFCGIGDDEDDGDNGSDGQDAGSLLIQYTRIEQLKNVRVISRPGDGGRCGRGCGGGSDGFDGSDGDEAVVYLMDISEGTIYQPTKNREYIKASMLNKKLTMSQNLYQKKSKVDS